MNITPETRPQALEELLRVAKKDLVLLEYNWRTLASTENPDKIDKFRELAFNAFAKFSTDPYMGEKLPEMLETTGSILEYKIENFRREEDVENTPELVITLRGMGGAIRNVFNDGALADELEALADDFERNPIAFEPPAIVSATVNKKSHSSV